MVIDGYGGCKRVTINNVPPTASLSGPATTLPGVSVTFTLAATDPSQPDQAAGFTYAINWGDGYSQSVTGLSGKTTSHTFASAGLYTVSMTATDKDHGVSKPVTQLVAVQGMAMHGTELVIVGTQGTMSSRSIPAAAPRKSRSSSTERSRPSWASLACHPCARRQ
ncbi:MAG: PKD domain-containing protein [Gemmataceae bacterium]